MNMSHLHVMRCSPSNSSHQTPSAIAVGKQREVSSSAHQQQSNGQPPPDDADRKRRPGRPRGSKNRRPHGPGPDASNTQSTGARPSSSQLGFYQYSSPPAPGEVHPHNQQYYEFQWRVLNLCAEFYGAAEELVVSCAVAADGGIDPLNLPPSRKRRPHSLSPNATKWVQP